MAAQSSTRNLSFSMDRLLQKSSNKRKESSSSSGSSTPPHSPPLFQRSTAPIMINAPGSITALPFTLAPLSGATPSLAQASAWTMPGTTFSSTSWNTVALGPPKIAAPWTFTAANNHHIGAFSQLKPVKGRQLSYNINRFSADKMSAVSFPAPGQIIKSPVTAGVKRSLPPPPPLSSPEVDEDDSDSSSPSTPLEGEEDGVNDTSCCSPSFVSNDSNQLDISREGDGSGKRYKKKKRTTFSNAQLQQLETRFNQQKYLTKLDRCRMAQGLGLTEKHIKTWYQNRRTKWKRECTDEMWSKERETAAANMYTQHLQMKSALSQQQQQTTTSSSSTSLPSPSSITSASS